MKKLIARGRAAFLAPLYFSLGCAVEPLDVQEADLADAESLRDSQQALGSTKARVDVSTWNGLVAMAADGNYRLTADINASGKSWSPKYFSGTFDGNGKTISNLTINVSGDAGFFSFLNQAIVKNVKFTNLSVTGTWLAGGLASLSQDSQVERIAIEGTITAASGFSVGGIFSEMIGGSLLRSYAKGTAQSAQYYAGGLVGFASDSDLGLATIARSYAQVTVSANTSDANRTVNAGGIVGRGHGVDIHDVYAVGNVTGRNGVGGLVGYLDCQNDSSWLLYKGIYRGDVVDKNVTNGGWAGTMGGYDNCHGRLAHLFWDASLDPSTNWLNSAEALLAQIRGTTAELRAPTTPYGGIYCLRPDNCPTDGNFDASTWDAGTSSQHHVLVGMPGPNSQLR